MKTIILLKTKLMLLALASLFIFSSNSQAGASLKATPSSLTFSTAINSQQTKSSNIQGVSLILGLNAPSTFSITLSGADADQFMIENPNPSLTTLLTTLLGIGYNTNITYKPNRTGTHTAKAIVSGNFLLLGNLSTEITLTGTTTDVTPPTIVTTTPGNNATNVVTGASITVTYDEPVTLANPGLISINGGGVSASVSGNVLTITPNTGLAFNTSYTVVIGAGAIKDAANNSAAAASFSFSTQQTPGFVVSSQNVAFSANLPGGQHVKYVNVKGSNLLVLNALENFNVSLEGTDANQFSVEQPTLSLGSLLTALLGDGLDIKITYKPVAEGPHNDARLKITGSLLFIGLLNTTVNLTGNTNTTDTTLPVPVSTSPNHGDTGVATNSAITITYSEAVTINSGSAITINGVAAQASVANNVLTVTPAQPLAYSTSYTVTTGPGAVKDAAGNLNAAFSFSFTTKSTPGFVTSSSSLSFSTAINTEQSKSVNVKGSNLLVLNVFEDFDVVLSGANANQFEVISPAPSLTGLATALLGDGYDIVIKYKPTTAGPHTAKVMVTGKLFGGTSVLSAEINLSGQTQDVTPPQIVSTLPANGDMGVGVKSLISVNYNEPVVANNSSLVTITKSATGTTLPAAITTSGSSMRIVPSSALEYNQSYEVKIKAGAIKDSNNNLTTSDYIFVFTTRPASGLSLSPNPIDFSTQQGVTTSGTLTLSGSNISSSATVTSFDVSITGTHATLFSRSSISQGAILAAMSTGGLQFNVTYTPPMGSAGSTHHAVLTFVVNITDSDGSTQQLMASVNLSGRSVFNPTGITDTHSSKNIVSEEIYNISGVRITNPDLNGIYIKKIKYEDGSVDTIKYYKSK